jgi:hypothetical protein
MRGPKSLVLVGLVGLSLLGLVACDSGGTTQAPTPTLAVGSAPTEEPTPAREEPTEEPTQEVGITPRVMSPTETPSGGGLPPAEEIGGPPIPIGKSGTIGNLKVTINSMRRWEGDSFYEPKPGNEYLIFDVTVENTGSEAARFSGSDLSLKNSTRQRAVGVILPLNKRTPSGTIAPGESKTGEWPTELPKSATDLVMVVDPFGSELTEIDLGQ